MSGVYNTKGHLIAKSILFQETLQGHLDKYLAYIRKGTILEK